MGRIVLVFSTILCAGAGYVAAAAAADESEPQGLEEIVVTAQKRSENLQQTPIAITAFTAAAIAKTGVSDIAELAERAPNVTFKFTAPISGASNAASVFIRGIGQSDFALTTDPGVGTYVDGIYLSRSVGGVLDVLDLERVEILRGPQGTLFGRNTIGGAINLLTQKPNFAQADGSVQIVGGSRNQLYLRADLNIPLADSLAVRLAVSSKNRDGYVNTAFPQSSPYYRSALTNLGNEDRQAARAEFLWKPIDLLDATLASDYSRVRENNAPAVLVGVTGKSSPADGPIAFLYNLIEAPTNTLAGFPNAQYSAANFVTGSPDKTYATGPNGTRLNGYGSALTLDFHLAPHLNLKSISAYHHEDGTFARDADGSPITLTDNIDTDYQHQQLSQELQLTGSAFAEQLKFATGVYYFRETGSDPLTVVFPASFGLLNIAEDRVRNTSLATYGQASYQLVSDLTLTAGARYTKDKKRFFTNQTLTISGPAGTAATGAPIGTVVPLVPPDSDVGQDFSNTSPRVALDYQLTRQTLLYASYSKGFKSGGFNLRYVVPRAAVRSFGPERADVVEIGAKVENAARTLQMNLAAFSTRYRDVQLTYFESFGAPVTANGGDSRIMGFDLELKALPLANLNVRVSAGYLDAYYTSLTPGLNAGATTPEQFITLESRLPNTPRWQFGIDLDYTVLLPQSRKLLFAVSGRHSSLVYNDAQNSPFLRQAPYTLADASTTFSSADDVWSLRLYVDNLADRRYIVSGDSNFGIGFHEAEFNRPREYGAGLTYRF